MENVSYFVMHPSLGVTAEVSAPTTEKARTTFLDWLERNNYISRSHRQAYRKNMVAERMEDAGAVRTDVSLHYGYRDSPIILGEQTRMPIPGGEVMETSKEEAPSLEGQQFEFPREEPRSLGALDLPKEKKGPSMPIQKVMLGVYE